MNEHHDDSLFDKARRLFGGSDEHGADAGDASDAADDIATHPEGDEHGELAGRPHGPETGHFVNDPPLRERPDLHPTSRDAGISDAARAATEDPTDDPQVVREGFGELGAASGQVVLPDGEEPVAGDEDWDKQGRGIG